MPTITLYHNPRCSKSRTALALLQDKHIDVIVVDYMKHPLTFAQLEQLNKLLDLAPRAMMRTKEAIYKKLNLDEPSLTHEDLIRVMVVHPILIQRPIVVKGNKAMIARPPETVLARCVVSEQRKKET